MKYTIQDLKEIEFKENTVYWCKTEKIANKLLAKASKKGYKWNIGDSYKEYNNWEDYEEETCYSIIKGVYSTKIFYEVNLPTYKIIEVTEEIFQEMRKACTQEQNKLFDNIFGIDCPYKEGELIFVRDSATDTWVLRYFSHVENGKVRTFSNQKKDGGTISWNYHAPAKGVTLPE